MVERSSLVLRYQSLACSIHPTGCKKAMHEKYSFSDMIFVNHSTSQTWSFLENEQFCIKWSISVNGGVLTSSHRAQCSPEKPSQVELLGLGWGSRLCLTTPGDCPTLGCKGQRVTFPFVKNGLGKAAPYSNPLQRTAHDFHKLSRRLFKNSKPEAWHVLPPSNYTHVLNCSSASADQTYVSLGCNNRVVGKTFSGGGGKAIWSLYKNNF